MGLLDRLKRAISGKAPSSPSEVAPSAAKFHAFDDAVQRMAKEHKAGGSTYYSMKVNRSEVYTAEIAPWPDKERVAFIVHLVKACHQYQSGRKTWSTGSMEYIENNIRLDLIQHLLRSKLVLDEGDVKRLFEAFRDHGRYGNASLLNWPMAHFLILIARQHKERTITSGEVEVLKQISAEVRRGGGYQNDRDRQKLLDRVSTILAPIAGEQENVAPIELLGDDPFVPEVNNALAAMPAERLKEFQLVLILALKASGSKPTEKYLQTAKGHIDTMGADTFRAVVHGWFDLVLQLKERTIESTYVYNGQTYAQSHTEFLGPQSMDLLKGLVWMCANFHDERSLRTVAALAERSFKKIPGKGPTAGALGNACLFTLFRSKGLDGIGHLSRLKLRVKQSSTVALIDKYLAQAAANKGISVYQIEDLACDDHWLKDGTRTWEFDGYAATLTVTGPGRSELQWAKPDGSPQNSVPAVVKEKHAAKLKKMKAVVKQVDLSTTAQRDRMDRMFRAVRMMDVPYFREHYVDHGLLCFLSRRIIWNVHADQGTVQAIWTNAGWTDAAGDTVELNDDMQVSLWHPATASVAEVRTWRVFLLSREIKQPLKQAYREVYLLTDAEVNTRTYSNRMAAHLLKQHQFNSLAKTRGWRYALQGAFDNGHIGEHATVSLPDHGISAQFWLNEVNVDDAMNDTGIWSYVATDQVRFGRIGNEDPMDLVDVPVVAFSEVMRDVDLFVGVASVGNDPEWRDGGAGVPGYRDYWQAYSFGDLGEVAKTRKEILTGLLPRLNIAKVCSIQDKFLVVKGHLRTYKIHLGSTNILMGPNDQYLCIVADRSKFATQNVFLPFEGDNGLSVIISKAFLLAEDRKITDSTITSQINRR